MKYLEGFWMWQLISNDDDYTTTLFFIFFIVLSLKRNCRHMHDWQAEQSRRKIVATCWEWMDFSWLSMREFSPLSSSYIYFCVLLIELLCHGKILFLFTATFNSFSSHSLCLSLYSSCSAFFFELQSINIWHLSIYKNDFSAMLTAMWFYDNDIGKKLNSLMWKLRHF